MSILKLVLASASPRRKELLAHFAIDYIVCPSKVDEGALIDRLGAVSPEELVQKLALAKASDVITIHRQAVVIGADTVVVLDGVVLGKPVDERDAAQMLRSLSGKTHAVYTGIAVVSASGSSTKAVRTSVTFKELTDSQIGDYVATGEPMDKAGSYGIQNAGITPVLSITGDYYNVVGLPLNDLRDLLKSYFPEISV